MTLDELLLEQENDSVIDYNKLDLESLKTPKLHAKWYRYYVDEMKSYRVCEVQYAECKKDRFEYYMGKADPMVYQEEPLHEKKIKQDLEYYMSSDKKLNDANSKMVIQQMKINLIESFLKTLANRGFVIKNSIDYQKFKSGN